MVRTIWLLVLVVAIIGCARPVPQRSPEPVPPPPQLAQPQPMPQPPTAAEPGPTGTTVTPAEEIDLRGGPEFGTRPHEDPAKPPVGAFLRGDPHHRLVALTFDDGPDRKFTPRVLDTLKRANVKATFFLVGSRAQANADVVRRIVAEGHEIGNHTMTHPQLTKLSSAGFRRELVDADRVIRRLTGRPVRVFRPPYGSASTAMVRSAGSLGYRTILWDIDSLDWKHGMTRQAVLGHVVPFLRNGAIILEHSAGGATEDLSDTVTALPEIIRVLRAKGYRPVTVSQLLATGHPVPGQW